MLKDDLEATGISYVDKSGRYADFHSLRHTTGTLLAAAGLTNSIIEENTPKLNEQQGDTVELLRMSKSKPYRRGLFG